MRRIMTAILVLLLAGQELVAQVDSTTSTSTNDNGRLFTIGGIIAFVAGIILYFILKKNPRKDAVR